MFSQLEDVPDLGSGQGNIAGNVSAVVSLTGDSCQNIDGGAALTIQRQVIVRLRHDGSHALDNRIGMVFSGTLPDDPNEVLPRLFPNPIIPVKPVFRGQAESRLFQPFFHSYIKTGIHFTRAGTALQSLPRTAPIECNFPSLAQREASIRLQQDRALGKHAAQTFQMFFFILQKFHEFASFRL